MSVEEINRQVTIWRVSLCYFLPELQPSTLKDAVMLNRTLTEQDCDQVRQTLTMAYA